jgi:phosphoribosylformimino-5-aminoimidazole carboxamide ribotide isomerase
VILFPAIDLKDGVCVRLVRGEMETATVFNRDPAAQARDFAALGFKWLHVVDLDGSFAGGSVNGEAVRAIRRAVDLKVQLGGGIRERAAIDAWLDLGIDRVVLGTAAARDPALVRRAAADHRGRVVVDIGVRDGKVAVQGWGETTDMAPVELAHRFADAGVAAIVYTDIARDGMLKGLNIDATIALAEAIAIPVIASGGLASLDDIRALLQPRAKKLAGAIAGRALYDGRLDAAAALKLIRSAEAA